MFNLDPATIISRLIILLIAFPIHEFAHAWTAVRFGDDTPRFDGRLTLNPLAHLDVMGSLLLLFSGFGWAKPVMVNPYTLEKRSPAARMLVSLAGPMSNFILAVLAAIPFRFGLLTFTGINSNGSIIPSPSEFLFQFIFINLTLMLFNLLPLAPLDGDSIAEYFFPPALARIQTAMRPYAWAIFLVLVFVLPRIGVDVLGTILYPPLLSILGLLGVL
jgi:Zn-dependent protease